MNKQEFIALIREETGLSEVEAQRIARAVLLSLRSQLSSNEVIDIDNTLPTDIDTLWHGGWLQMLMTRLQSLRDLNKEEFIEQVRESADIRTAKEAEDVTVAVFRALKKAIPCDEVEHLSKDLGDGLEDLWQAA